MTTSSDHRKAVAHHEAGHAVAAFYFGHPIKSVTIAPSGDFAGQSITSPSYGGRFHPDAEVTPRQYVKMLEDIVVCFAGHEAEAAFRGRQDWRRSSHDRSIAIDLVSYLSGDAESLSALLRWRRVVARHFVESRATEIRAVAAALLERTTLTSEGVRDAIAARPEF